MRFEWDPAKNAMNKAKHGLDFEDAPFVFDGRMLTAVDTREYGETRYSAYGLLFGRVVNVIYTIRGDCTRIISLRKANARETKDFRAAIGEE